MSAHALLNLLIKLRKIDKIQGFAEHLIIFCHNMFNNQYGHRFFFIFCFTDFFRDKLRSEDEIKMKIKFIRTIFQFTELKSKETRFRVSFDFNSIGK